MVPRWMHEMFSTRFNKMLEAEGQGDLQYVIKDVEIEDIKKLIRVAIAARMYLKAERIERKSAHLHHWFVVSHASDERAIRALKCWRKELDESIKAMEVLSV